MAEAHIHAECATSAPSVNDRDLKKALAEAELEESFEDNVAAEERIKARALSTMRLAQLGRGDSPRSSPPSPGHALDRKRFAFAPNESDSRQIDISERFKIGAVSRDIDIIREEIDVRNSLFEEHDAYPHSVDFQRVIITEVGGERPLASRHRYLLYNSLTSLFPVDDIDEDSLQSCKVLKKCMELRNKYISAHPHPPQDLAPHFEQHATVVAPSPIKKGQFRRRQDPEYDVFSRRVADRLDGYTYRLENGVFCVYRTPTEGEVAASAPPPENMYPVTSFQEFVADFEYVSSSVCPPAPSLHC